MFYIMLRKSGVGTSATYAYLTDIEAGTGAIIKKSFPTIEAAQDYVKEMLVGGDYSLNSFIVVKGVTVSIDATLAEES